MSLFLTMVNHFLDHVRQPELGNVFRFLDSALPVSGAVLIRFQKLLGADSGKLGETDELVRGQRGSIFFPILEMVF